MIEYKVVDNFLSKENFDNLCSIVSRTDFPFFPVGQAVHGHEHTQKSNFFFYHNLFAHSNPSSFFEPFRVILKRLKVISLVNMRINLTIYREGTPTFPVHNDLDFYGNTGILYLNSTDGPTVLLLENEKKVIESRANRFLTFKSNIKHYSINHSDPVFRYLVNMNYSPEKDSEFDFKNY